MGLKHSFLRDHQYQSLIIVILSFLVSYNFMGIFWGVSIEVPLMPP